LLRGNVPQLSAALGLTAQENPLARVWDETITAIVDRSLIAIRLLMAVAE